MNKEQDMPRFVAFGIYKGKVLPFVRTYYDHAEVEKDREQCSRFYYTPFGEYNMLLDCLVHRSSINDFTLSEDMWDTAMAQMNAIMDRHFPVWKQGWPSLVDKNALLVQPGATFTIHNHYGKELDPFGINGCPFCKNNLDEFDIDDCAKDTENPEAGHFYYVWCMGCGMNGPFADSRGEAVRLWNRLEYRVPLLECLPNREGAKSSHD